jgi:predicted dehydrogenase
MQKINWGIIGCGDVTELKSGPAFNKVENSSLVAVMRRDSEKAKDYASRHNVPKWYDDANQLINDPRVDAVYIATPPSSHEEYTMASIKAGKPVYVEKPMSVDFASAARMTNAAKENNVKLSVAHYRRAQPFFKKIKQLIGEKVIGDIRFARLELYKKSLTKEELSVPKISWRVDTGVAGGGLFNDLAPHQLDLARYFFGEINDAKGYSLNQAGLYNADDIVAGNILFKSGVIFSGVWCFNVPEKEEKDSFEIIGSGGKLSFSIFNEHIVTVSTKDKTEIISFEIPMHVQQPMITDVVKYFLNQAPNPCSGDDGAVVMQLIDQFTQ